MYDFSLFACYIVEKRLVGLEAIVVIIDKLVEQADIFGVTGTTRLFAIIRRAGLPIHLRRSRYRDTFTRPICDASRLQYAGVLGPDGQREFELTPGHPGSAVGCNEDE